jgi:transposase-like protein
VIDFRLASAESAAQWEQFLGDLMRRGLTGAQLEMLCVDDGGRPARGLAHGLSRGAGAVLLGAQDPQRAGQGAQADQAAIKASLHRIMNATTLPRARSAARRFAERWGAAIPGRWRVWY